MFRTPKSGTAVISTAISSFTKVVEELETGIALCAQEEEVINDEIASLNKTLSITKDSKVKATNIKANIEKLLEA